MNDVTPTTAKASGEICILTHLLDCMPCGVGRYLETLLEEFKAFDFAGRIHLVHYKNYDHPHYRYYRNTIVPLPKGPYRETRWAQWILPRTLAKMNPAMVHCTIQSNPPVMWLHAPTVLTIHDLIPLLVPEREWPWYRRWLIYRLILGRAIARAAAVTVPSESTRRDVMRLFGRAGEAGGSHRITVIPEAADRRFRPRPDLARPMAERYVLYVGSLALRKNVPLLLRAVAMLKGKGSDMPLLLVVSREEFAEFGLGALARELGVAGINRCNGAEGIEFGQRPSVPRREGGYGARAEAQAAGGAGAGQHDEQVAAHGGNRLVHRRLGPLPNGQHQHHGGHADHHAEHGQRRAQPVQRHGAPGFGGDCGKFHAVTAPSYTTRPSTNRTMRRA